MHSFGDVFLPVGRVGPLCSPDASLQIRRRNSDDAPPNRRHRVGRQKGRGDGRGGVVTIHLTIHVSPDALHHHSFCYTKSVFIATTTKSLKNVDKDICFLF